MEGAHDSWGWIVLSIVAATGTSEATHLAVLLTGVCVAVPCADAVKFCLQVSNARSVQMMVKAGEGGALQAAAVPVVWRRSAGNLSAELPDATRLQPQVGR